MKKVLSIPRPPLLPTFGKPKKPRKRKKPKKAEEAAFEKLLATLKMVNERLAAIEAVVERLR